MTHRDQRPGPGQPRRVRVGRDVGLVQGGSDATAAQPISATDPHGRPAGRAEQPPPLAALATGQVIVRSPWTAYLSLRQARTVPESVPLGGVGRDEAGARGATLIDLVHLLGSFMDTFAVLYPQVQDVDFRTDARTLPVPVVFVEGAHEAPGRVEPFHQWYAELSAPRKELAVLDHSGHRPLFEQPHQFVTFMTGTVLAQTAKAQR